MSAFIRKLFKREKQPPLVCAISLDETGTPIGANPEHKHTGACFIEFEPLAVVELFQSQGCHSCPPAIPGIQEATNKPNVLLLTYNVTFFDHLGWRDTFASAGWDRRQKAYVKRWNRSSLFTPHVVVNGIADGSGAGGISDVDEIVDRARSVQKTSDWHIYVDADSTDIHIHSDIENIDSHDICVIVYDSTDSIVKVRKGSNKGKKINHRNVVKEIFKVGEWTGGTVTLPLPTAGSSLRPGQKAVVVIQHGGPGGPVVAAAEL